MKNSDLVRMISIYEASSRHLAEDYLLDMEKSAAAEALVMDIVDLNYPNFELFGQLTWGSPFAFPPNELLETYAEVDLRLLVDDTAKLRTLVNRFGKLGDQVSIRVNIELPEHIARARELIELLESEYPE